MVQNSGSRNVGILGLSFKAGTDDLRESPIVEIAERLLGKGFNILIYDRNVQLARLTGANRDYLLNRIPHISRLLVDDLATVVDHGDTIVIGNSSPEFAPVLDSASSDKKFIDLVRIAKDLKDSESYEGIAW
jgi:GDP-mannose 6-dehydrogenase